MQRSTFKNAVVAAGIEIPHRHDARLRGCPRPVAYNAVNRVPQDISRQAAIAVTLLSTRSAGQVHNHDMQGVNATLTGQDQALSIKDITRGVKTMCLTGDTNIMMLQQTKECRLIEQSHVDTTGILAMRRHIIVS